MQLSGTADGWRNALIKTAAKLLRRDARLLGEQALAPDMIDLDPDAIGNPRTTPSSSPPPRCLVGADV